MATQANSAIGTEYGTLEDMGISISSQQLFSSVEERWRELQSDATYSTDVSVDMEKTHQASIRSSFYADHLELTSD